MKRYGKLWSQVVDIENIRLAYRKAAKGKRWQRTVKAVAAREDEALCEVQEMLVNRKFSTAPYRQKQVYEPKERTIYILPFFPDRIVQHAVMNIVSPLWDRSFDGGSHACRPGTGQHSASRAVMQYVRRYRYVLHADVRKFYPSIDQGILMRLIERKVKDEGVLWLLEDIVRSFPGDKNLPIGNLTSQWAGNFYLNELDKYVRHDLKPGAYARYNDDFLLFGNDKNVLIKAQERCRLFLDSNLSLDMAKDRVYPTAHGVDFVGYRHFSAGYVLVRKSTARRVKSRISRLRYELAIGSITPERARSVLASTNGWLKWASSHNFRQSIRIDELQEDVIAQVQRLRHGGQAA